MQCLKWLFWGFLFFSSEKIFSQVPLQNVHGIVRGKSIHESLRGVTVFLDDVSVVYVLTDSIGRFKISGVKVGRHSFVFSSMGYKTVVISNILIESGKEVELNVEMEEDLRTEKEIIIRAQQNKNKPVNNLALVSARMFSVEETRRFAAGLNDPSRIATAFAGVTSNGGDYNALVIRGNAPNGLLWRMEGVDIPNPNHFARVGTSGGAISILSAQLLANSDFMTGAFPSEYGNALSGVFDIHLRKGNAEKREHTFSVSTIGVDAATEGYFKKGKRSSYLINYRYGFLTLMQKIGFNIGEAVTAFQDLSFNMYFPTKKIGEFTLFGFGGKSEQRSDPSRDSLTWLKDPAKRSGWRVGANTGALGATHSLVLGKKTFLRSVLSVNSYSYYDEDDRLDKFNGPLVFTRKNKFDESNLIYSFNASHKFNKRFLIKSGIVLRSKSFDLLQRETVSNILTTKISSKGSTALHSSFIQFKWDPLSKLTFQFGLHHQYLGLNKKSVFEPRIGARYMLNDKQSISLGYGLHSQIQPLGNYFARIKVGSDTILANRDLDFSRSRHWVVGYNFQFLPNWNFKMETYYQWLYNIPISPVTVSTFSLINQEDDFAIEKLVNKGLGQNYGAEFTLEKFWNDRFYMLATLSLYESGYKVNDAIWRSTRFNSNNASSFVIGKEWSLGGKKISTIAIDAKILQSGGIRVTPIDLTKSIALKRTVFLPGAIYEEKLPSFFRTDIQMEWKRQYKRSTGSAILGVQNVTNRKNAYSQTYDAGLGKIRYRYLLGLIPVMGYKIDF